MSLRLMTATCLLVIGVAFAADDSGPAWLWQLLGFIALLFVPALIADHIRHADSLLDRLLDDWEDDDGDTPVSDTPLW